MANEKKETHALLNTDIEGDVKIADDVVAQIAAIAAEEVEGVGVSTGNLGSTIMAYVGVKKNEKRVKVEVAENIVHVEMTITVLYGYNIPDVSRKVQERVKSTIENMTGLSVADVDIRVSAVEMEKDSEE